MNKKGSILMITLWILAILVIFALGLGQRASLNLRQARYQRDRLKATYLAKAGINRAIVELEKDKDTNGYDSLGETWSTGLDSNNKNIFENIELKVGSGETFRVNITDEERRININVITTDFVKQALEKSFEITGVEDYIKLNDLIFKWIDQNPEGDAEKDKIFKNDKLKSPEELLLILEYFYKDEEKTSEVYNKVNHLITTFGDEKININTVSEEVLKDILMPALFNVLQSAYITMDQLQDISNRIIYFRNSGGVFDIVDIETKLGSGMTTQQFTAIGEFKKYIDIKSSNFRIETAGVVGKINKKVTAIYNRHYQDNKIVYWHEN